MSLAGILIAGLMFVTLSAVAIGLTLHAFRMKERLDATTQKATALEQLAHALQHDVNGRTRDCALLAQANKQLGSENEIKDGWLFKQDQEAVWLRAQLEQRPRLTRKAYKILTLGVKYTGKTSLTLKWANPLFDLGALKGTKIERYERTVSHVLTKDVLVEHVFEIHDWGGEHVVDAQQELVTEEVHGMLLVVDLAGKDAKGPDLARIQQQLRAFQPESLQFFFGPRTAACCKTIILFINKSDVLSGTPAEVEKEARGYYKRLIDDLEQYKNQVEIRVLVGSASYGHSTHHLFAHFVEKILPKNAYDGQLLQRMKATASTELRPMLNATANAEPRPLAERTASMDRRPLGEKTVSTERRSLLKTEGEPPRLPPVRANGKPGRPAEEAHHGGR